MELGANRENDIANTERFTTPAPDAQENRSEVEVILVIAPDTETSMESSAEHLLRELIDRTGLRRDQPAVAQVARMQTRTVHSDAGRFTPQAPRSLAETGLEDHQLEALILRFLLNRGAASGAGIAKQVRLPFAMVSEFLRGLKESQLVAHRRSSGALGDFEYQLTDKGIDQSRRFAAQSTYFGAAPVPFADYVTAVTAQSVSKETITQQRLHAALADLSLSDEMLSRLGQAMTAGRALFLFGLPGNGKTSIAERLTAAFGSEIWIPRAILCDGDIVRVYDPMLHVEVATSGLTQADEIDQRWICIRRPTIVVGGELTMDNLEITVNQTVGILEAPLQLKSNCGTLVIDDFGRQRMSPDQLLNRWIVPLEKQHDYLNFPSGKKVQIPFDQVIVFSTNLDPSRLVDEAFLRRIPYKIEARDPSEAEFRTMFKAMADKYGITFIESSVDYLLARHYRCVNRPLRYCHPRDLMLQIKHLCEYHQLPREMTPKHVDIAVSNYFGAVPIPPTVAAQGLSA